MWALRDWDGRPRGLMHLVRAVLQAISQPVAKLKNRVWELCWTYQYCAYCGA
jgi:hypothetical protein